MQIPDYMVFSMDRPGVCIVDPDKFYPLFLEEIEGLGEFEIEVQRGPGGPTEKVKLRYEGEPDQYWLEVCVNFMKMDTVFWARMLKLGRIVERRVLASSPDHKQRWAQSGKKPGRVAEIEARFGARNQHGTSGALSNADAQIRREAREIYKLVRGVVPDMAL